MTPLAPLAALAALLLVLANASASAQNAGTPAAAPPQAAPPAAAPSTAKKAAPPPLQPDLETLAAAEARDILGKKVSGAAGEDMGLVVDVLFDAQKQPRAVVIDFGGFLGVGTCKIAVAWKLLQFQPAAAKTPLKVALTRADIQAAPEYKEGAKTVGVVVGPAKPAAATPTPVTPAPSPPSSPPSSAPAPAAPAPAGH